MTRTSSPCVRAYDSTSRSPPAFAAAYGEFGDNGASSVHEPASIEPYTSSVDTCTSRAPAARHAAASRCAPTALVSANTSAAVIDRSTWVSAAKLTTTSWPGTSDASSSLSQMSPFTNVYPPATGSRLAGLPAYASLSRTVTSAPAQAGNPPVSRVRT